MNGNGVEATARPAQAGLRATDDARAIIRLLQCSQCSYPLRQPLTLACGNTLCRACLPPLFKRENITYPLGHGRLEGFVCPFKDCGLEHVVGDCNLDVTLNKLVEVFRMQTAVHRGDTVGASIALDERLHWPDIVNSSMDVMPRSRVLGGGRLVATYTFADMGELNYYSEVAYNPIDCSADESAEALDVAVLESWKEVARTELECQVCYALILDPMTSACGHTFCRKCVARVLDHSSLCPACRRTLLMVPGVQLEPSNKRISLLIESFFPTLLSERLATAEHDEAIDEITSLPLFPCSLAYPHMPTFLHIFEPRYRLMIRRAMENGSRKFGMMMYNQRRILQGSLGYVEYLQYGTMLHIERVEMLPDGRSLVETKGVSRFRVLGTSHIDGYLVGRIQRIDDVPLADEEAAEARETGSESLAATTDPVGQIDQMSTQGLLQYGLDFVGAAQLRSARWLHQRVLAAYGQPPSDPALFPYWFASILPIAEEEKYCLLPTTSVRERLKITARWIQRLEAARCAYEEEIRARMAQHAVRFSTIITSPRMQTSTEEPEQVDRESDDSEGDGGRPSPSPPSQQENRPEN